MALYPARERPSDGLWQALDVEGITVALSPPGGRRSPRITRRLVWEDYSEEAAEAGRLAYSYSHFCTLLAKATGGGGSARNRPANRKPTKPAGWRTTDSKPRPRPEAAAAAQNDAVPQGRRESVLTHTWHQASLKNKLC